MVTVPAGSFQRGSNDDEEWDDYPQHRVTVKPFKLARHEVTFNEYDRFATATGRELPSDSGWGRGTKPVINISWLDANAYIRWLNQASGRQFRLPTEAEWEYAARAKSLSSSSADDDLRCQDADFGYSRCSSEGTSAVGSYPANGFGLFDMQGNVSEYLQDCFSADYRNSPTDGSALLSGNCEQRALRGGSWYDDSDSLAPSYRASIHIDESDDGEGFRLAEDLSE